MKQEKDDKGIEKQKKRTPEKDTIKKPEAQKKPREIQRKKFIVSGKFLMGDTLQKFQREVEARGEQRAREKIYQDMGSRHRVKRSRILIQKVEEIP